MTSKDNLDSKVSKTHCPRQLSKGNCIGEECTCKRKIGIIGPVTFYDVIILIIRQEIIHKVLLASGCNWIRDIKHPVLDQNGHPIEDVVLFAAKVHTGKELSIQPVLVGKTITPIRTSPFLGQFQILRTIKTQAVVIMGIALSEHRHRYKIWGTVIYNHK